MLRLPQFSIAQLLGFTFVCALNVWAFVWDFSVGFWTTLLSQVLPALFSQTAVFEFLSAPTGATIVSPDSLLPLGPGSKILARSKGNRRRSLWYVSRLLPGQLFEGEQQQSRGIAFQLLDPFPVFLFLGLLGGPPLVVLWKPLPHDRASCHQMVPQPFALKIEFSSHKQISCFLDSLLGKMG